MYTSMVIKTPQVTITHDNTNCIYDFQKLSQKILEKLIFSPSILFFKNHSFHSKNYTHSIYRHYK